MKNRHQQTGSMFGLGCICPAGQWMDARTAESYWSGHIPDAIHVSAGEFDSQILSLLDVRSPEKSVIVYCDSRLCDASKEVA
jgi:rhodanese-related sulfurtransferase